MNPPAPQPRDAMIQIITHKWVARPLKVAAQLGLADMLADGPLGVEELALRSQAHAPTLFRMMRALAAVGVFEQLPEDQFGLTPLGRCLQTGAMRELALLFLSDWHDQAWADLMHSVKTGEPAFDHAFGQPAFAWLAEHKEEGDIFSQAMMQRAGFTSQQVNMAYDFSSTTHLTDVGGGYGALLIGLLRAHEHLRGTVADLPSVTPGARARIAEAGLASRCQVVDCDFFKEIPAGGDTYLMANVLHDWDDGPCRAILANCHRAMRAGAKLLLAEYILPEGGGFSPAKLLDLEMLVLGGGRERTEAEFEQLLDACGFAMTGIHPSPEGLCVIESLRN